MQLNNMFGATGQNTIAQQQTKKEQGIGDPELDKFDFLNLLIAQLQNQDPLSPLESNDFTSQTTMFSQLDQMMSMNKSISELTEILKQQATNSSSLINGANFIGKEVEFSTNTVTLGKDVSNFSFYLGSAPDNTKSTISVYNKAGELVATVKPSIDMKTGANVIPWDGKGLGGVELPDGTYQFEVNAFGTDGKKVEVETFGKEVVTGVKMVNGVLFFDTANGVVSSEYVYSVTNPKVEKPTEKPEDKPTDKPTEDKKQA